MFKTLKTRLNWLRLRYLPLRAEDTDEFKAGCQHHYAEDPVTHVYICWACGQEAQDL